MARKHNVTGQRLSKVPVLAPTYISDDARDIIRIIAIFYIISVKDFTVRR